ncbi:MAG: RNA polymerase sigma factor [Thermoleophilaceae bacterium]
MTTLPPFQLVLDRHGGAVYRFLVASVGPQETDDCFQEACMAALRAYPDLRHADNLKGWLLTIAHRKALDSYRAAARRPVPVEHVPERADADGTLPGLEGQPVWARVRELPEKQRMAVFLRSVADLSYADVATAMECSQDAARRSVHEGLKRLREDVTR